MTADHFSGVAAAYARFRPRYPVALFTYLAAEAPSHALAWDVGTGNGQAAVALAAHFDRVVATDLSAMQIAAAARHPRVQYAVAPASESGLRERTVDLITVAQALHWFDRPLFFGEVRRVLRPGGLLAVWGYGPFASDDAQVQAVMTHFYINTVGPYWPSERSLVEEGYRSVALPFEEISVPAFALEADLSLDALAGYAGTWSATQRCARATGTDPVPAFRAALAAVWGAPQATRRICWPLSLRVARRPG